MMQLAVWERHIQKHYLLSNLTAEQQAAAIDNVSENTAGCWLSTVLRDSESLPEVPGGT
jgi:hypothetical protein